MSQVLEPQITNEVSSSSHFAYGLTITQKLFCDYYIENRNGLKSAQLAGYSGSNATLRAIASENLTKPNIRAYLEDRYAERVIGANETLAELSKIATFDVINSDKDSPIRAVDKLKALELAGKFYKHWDRTEAEADSRAVAEQFFILVKELADRERKALEAPSIDVTPINPTSCGLEATSEDRQKPA